MIKLIDILENKILVPRRSKEERAKNYNIATQKKIQQHIKDGGKGNLNLSNTPITSLPDDLTKVGGYLSLHFSKITSLPNNLKVGGGLYLSNTPITSLPNNLQVGGGLDLNNSQITSLPNNLKVRGYVDVESTPLTSLPNNLQVGGYLDLNNTPLSKKYTKEEIIKMIEDKGGEVKDRIFIG